MVDAGIGRLLISSLHQGIADVSPTRLEFYENWLSPSGMRDGRIGLAPLGAVLGLGKRLVFATVRQSKVKKRMSGSTAVVEIQSELCQQLRDPATVPMRGFYAAALQRLFARCHVDATVGLADERPGGWRLSITVNGSLSPGAAAAA